MAHELLEQWLQLPEGSWPPDHYTLLALSPGTGSSEDVEMRVLERMDLLRRYQLPHPEIVTDGMNRLAQAMICLTSPDARQKYDRSLGLVVAEPTVAVEPPVFRLAPLLEAPPLDPPRLSDEDTQPYTIPLMPLEPLELPEIHELPPEREDILRSPREQASVAPVRKGGRKRQVDDPETRILRRLYRELSRIRRVMERLRTFRAYVDEPERTFGRRTEAAGLVQSLNELREELPAVQDLIGGPGLPGNLMAVLARQEHGVDMLRSLLPSQQESLAQDCRSAYYRLASRYTEVRAEANMITAKSWERRILYPMLRHMIDRPEYILLLVGGFALWVAFLRTLGGL